MVYSQNGRSVVAKPKAISGPEASIWKGWQADATANEGMMSASTAGSSDVAIARAETLECGECCDAAAWRADAERANRTALSESDRRLVK